MNAFGRSLTLISLALALVIGGDTSGAIAGDDDQLFEIAGELKDKIGEYKDAVELFDKVEKMLVDAQQGQKPPPQGGAWKTLVTLFQTRTAELEKMQIPTDFRPDDYAIALEDIFRCERRNWAIDQLNRYLQELSDFDAKGKSTQAKLKELTETISRVSEDFKSLLALHEKLLAADQDFITWNWWDLSQHVVPATTNLEAATLKQQTKVNVVLALVENRIANLTGNVKTIKESECVLHEKWIGQLTIESDKYPVALAVTKVDGRYALDYSIKGTTVRVCPIKVDIPSRLIEYRPACSGPSTLITQLRVAPEYTSMVGEMVDTADPDVKFPITLGMQ